METNILNTDLLLTNCTKKQDTAKTPMHKISAIVPNFLGHNVFLGHPSPLKPQGVRFQKSE